MDSSMPGESVSRMSQAVKKEDPNASSDLQRGNLSETRDECISDKVEQKRQLAALKTYTSYKAIFSKQNVYEPEVWRKIAEVVRAKCLHTHSGYYGAKECRDEINSIKKKYFKVKNGKLDVTSPDDATLIEEAKLAFDSNEPVSDKVKQERQLAALKAYNLYKDVFSVPNACEPELWGKIAKIVRKECPNSGYYGAQQCRDEVRSIKNRYLKAGKGKLDVSSPHDALLMEEAKLAFKAVVNLGKGSSKASKQQNKQKDELALSRAYNEYKDEFSSHPEHLKRTVWKIAKQLRISRSVNGISGFNEKHCFALILSLKKKYEKKKNCKSANPDEAIFLNEAALAFGDPEFQGYGYRRDNYGSGHGSNNPSGQPSASNDGLMKYGRSYKRDIYGSGYESNSQRGPPNASNEGNEHGSGYRRDSYGGGYGSYSQGGPPSGLNDGNEYGSGYRRDTYGDSYRSNNQGGPPSAVNDGNEYESGYRKDTYDDSYRSNNQVGPPGAWSYGMEYG